MMERIAERLYVADFESGSNPPRPGFAVLNASRGVHGVPPGAADYRHLPLLYIEDPDWLSTLEEGVAWIEFWRDDRGLDVLVHCRAGLDRSVAYVLAYLVRQGMSWNEAFARVRDARSAETRPPDPELLRRMLDWAGQQSQGALPPPEAGEQGAVPGVMVVGTRASIGKSFLTTALARYLAAAGLRVGVFKTLITVGEAELDSVLEGGFPEAAWVAALAARRPPTAAMSPVVLVPRDTHVDADNFAFGQRFRLVLDGVEQGTDLTWPDLFGVRHRIEQVLLRRYREIAADSDVVVIEGAGAAVEPHNPLSVAFNLRFAQRAGARTFLVGDALHGGGAAALLGSLAMISPAHRTATLGVVLNRAGYGAEAEYASRCGTVITALSGQRFLGAVPLLEGVGRIALNPDPTGRAVTWSSVLDRLPAHVLGCLDVDLAAELGLPALSGVE